MASAAGESYVKSFVQFHSMLEVFKNIYVNIYFVESYSYDKVMCSIKRDESIKYLCLPVWFEPVPFVCVLKWGRGSKTAVFYVLLGFRHIKVFSLADNIQMYLNYFIPSLFNFAHTCRSVAWQRLS